MIRDFAKKYSGTLADIVFIAAYALMPLSAPALREAGQGSSALMYSIGAFSIYLYPLAYAAMAHRMVSEQKMKEGLAFLDGALWKWYTWPLGILFWVALLFHGVTMSMSFTWGEMITGQEVHGRVAVIDAWIGIAAFLALSIVIVARMWGLSLKNLLKIVRILASPGAIISRIGYS